MKYIKKMPSTDKALSANLVSEGWKKIKEPSSLITATLFSIPFMLINFIITLTIVTYLYPPIQEFLSLSDGFKFTLSINLFTLLYIISILLFMTIHEFLHAAFIPNMIKSEKTFWGINGIYGFVFTTEKIKKGRFIIISLMPFILLSLVLPFILSILGWLNGYTILLCLINAGGSCVDCLNTVLIVTQVPNGSYIVNNGFETYYK